MAGQESSRAAADPGRMNPGAGPFPRHNHCKTLPTAATVSGVNRSAPTGGVRLFEAPGAGRGEGPWAAADTVQLDAPLWQLLRGALPREMTLEGGEATLRFDRQGHLLTRLPAGAAGDVGDLGQVHMRNCRL